MGKISPSGAPDPTRPQAPTKGVERVDETPLMVGASVLEALDMDGTLRPAKAAGEAVLVVDTIGGPVTLTLTFGVAPPTMEPGFALTIEGNELGSIDLIWLVDLAEALQLR